MRERDPELVTAAEIAAWAYCPESWRLSSLGHVPENRAAAEKGRRHHANQATFKEFSGRPSRSAGGSSRATSRRTAA
jgi:hypothetical protein